MARSDSAANLLRELRHEQGRSLRTAAADIGVAPSQLSRIERGQRSLANELSDRIASYYGVPRDLVALSGGDVPLDVVHILQRHPDLIEYLRANYGRDDSGVEPASD